MLLQHEKEELNYSGELSSSRIERVAIEEFVEVKVHEGKRMLDERRNVLKS